jgi:hypothetical protein
MGTSFAALQYSEEFWPCRVGLPKVNVEVTVAVSGTFNQNAGVGPFLARYVSSTCSFLYILENTALTVYHFNTSSTTMATDNSSQRSKIPLHLLLKARSLARFTFSFPTEHLRELRQQP